MLQIYPKGSKNSSYFNIVPGGGEGGSVEKMCGNLRSPPTILAGIVVAMRLPTYYLCVIFLSSQDYIYFCKKITSY